MKTKITLEVPEEVIAHVEQVQKLECCNRDRALEIVLRWAASAASREMSINAKREERFLELVDKTPGYGPNGDCWRWTGLLCPKGYSRFKVRSNYIFAHRKMYEDVIGPIPKDLVCDHLCRTRDCVNPYHLDIVTSVTNTKRGNSGKFQMGKTHCPKGHEYTPENVYMYKTSRSCRECRKQSTIVRNANLKQQRQERKDHNEQ